MKLDKKYLEDMLQCILKNLDVVIEKIDVDI